MNAQLRCTLFPGQFRSELAALIRSATGRELSLFAQKADLEFLELPGEGRPVDGWIKVKVLECERGLCLVQLPQTTLENGQYITVTANQLDQTPPDRTAGLSNDPLEPGTIRGA